MLISSAGVTIQEYVQQGWAAHESETEALAARLVKGIELVDHPAQLPFLAGLIVHVTGEHLGRWRDGVALLERLTELALFDEALPGCRAVYHFMAVLYYCAGDLARADELERRARNPDLHEASGRIRMLAIASSALAFQKRSGEAMAAFREARRLAGYAPGPADPASRALAINANNLACELEVLPSRSEDEVELMLLAAATAREFWQVAGTWVEVKRAEYRLAMSHLVAGQPGPALEHAEQALALCDEHDAEPRERFFALEGVALARAALGDADAVKTRDAACALLDAIDEGDRAYCRGELEQLDAKLAR